MTEGPSELGSKVSDTDPTKSAQASRGTQRTPLHLGLVHWPIRDKAGDIICTNVTNFDVHDIARACRTYGVEKYHIINRIPEQQMFVSRLKEHWMLGAGAKYNPMRKTALGIVTPQETLEATIESFEQKPYVVATSAREREGIANISFQDLRDRLEGQKSSSGAAGEQDMTAPVLLIFGTGFGLAEEVYELCDAVLPPIQGRSIDDYRHLSVRSAVSIILDRLMGA